MKSLKFLFLQFFLFIFIFSGFTYKSSAQDNWDFTIAPYFWFASLSGDATLKGNTSEVDASFSDLWDALNFAASLRFEAYNKPTKFGILIDGAYFDLEDEATTDFFNSLINIKTEVEVEFLMLDQGIFYRFIALDSPVQANLEYPKFTLDGLFFGRIWYMDQTIDIQGQGPAGLGTSVSDDQTWFDFNLGL
ncbi:MAG: hypothetical protein GTN99_05560, partial [Candidatus Dadabacteria bacterium]|nr:hypothetical protein [Candidatus Dadabacteria bacterium]